MSDDDHDVIEEDPVNQFEEMMFAGEWPERAAPNLADLEKNEPFVLSREVGAA